MSTKNDAPVPEVTHMLMWVLSDRAIPRSLRMMQGFGVHTFKLVNAQGKVRFVKFHWKPLLGVHSLVWDEAQKIGGKDPDFHRRDLWDAIAAGAYPEYELGLQIIEEKDEHAFNFDLLDPLRERGVQAQEGHRGLRGGGGALLRFEHHRRDARRCEGAGRDGERQGGGDGGRGEELGRFHARARAGHRPAPALGPGGEADPGVAMARRERSVPGRLEGGAGPQPPPLSGGLG
jgi:Catalase